MKYLVCLVALLLLCLSPNPSFAEVDYKSEGFWAYENYWAVLASIDELFFDGKPFDFESKAEELSTEQKRALIPKFEEFVEGLEKEKPNTVKALIGGIKLLNQLRRARDFDGLPEKVEKAEGLPEKVEKAEGLLPTYIRRLLRSLAAIIPYSSLEDKVDLDSLERDEVELMKRTRQTLCDLGWKHFEGESLDKFGFQLTKSESPNKSRRSSKSPNKSRRSPESPNKSRSSSKSPNKSRSSSKSPERSQRTISPQ